MPSRALPDNPSLEHLKNQAKSLQRRTRAGDPDAIAQVREFHPHYSPPPGSDADGIAGSEEFRSFALTEAQLVIARSYGFAAWQRLRQHLEVLAEYSRWPEPADEAAAATDPSALAALFLNLACLNYTQDSPSRQRRARALLEAHPDIAIASVHTMAAVGDVDGLRRALARDPGLARQSGGPYDWEPLIYLCYSRIGDIGAGRSAVAAARVLLDAGADPDTGYLWQAMTSPFTALTGVFGGGEQGQPPHPQALALARVLLEAGADPNDNQTLYNRMFEPANDHLELLFEFGLGTDIASPWRQRLGQNAYPSVAAMVEEQLRYAAEHGFGERVRLLLDHGVDPDGRGYHPSRGDRTALQVASQAGHRDIVRMLAEAGAAPATLDPQQEFVSACLAADRAEAERLLAARPSVGSEAAAAQPDALRRAAETGRLDAVRLMLDLGFDVNAGGVTALHEAAIGANLPLVRLLLDHGADPRRRDPHHGGTALGWAEYGASVYPDEDKLARHQETVEFLRALEQG